MKRSIFIPLILISVFGFSQGPGIIELDYQNGKAVVVKGVLTDLILPVTFAFSDKFNGKSIRITDENRQILAPKIIKFGTGDLTKDVESGDYKIIISSDRTINPGDERINPDKFLIEIEQQILIVTLNSNPATVAQEEPQKSQNYIAGYIYYDAMKLVDENTIPQTKIEILNAYKVDATDIGNNPFLSDVFKELFKKNIPQGIGVTSLLTSLGNTDVTYFAAGLARFLAERTKDELDEAFFNKMKKQLSEYPELSAVFPQTTSFLNVIETYAYASIIQVLKEAFETDIQNLPANLYRLKSLTEADCNSGILKGDKLSDCKTRLEKLKAFFESRDGRWIGLGMFTIKEAMESANPADLLKLIIESTDFKGVKEFSRTNSEYTDYNIASSIELSNFISQSMISKVEKQVWINFSDLNALFKTKNAFKVYLGLLLAREQCGDIKIDFYKDDNNTITFGGVLKEIYKKYAEYEPQISNLIKDTYAAFNSANNAVKKIIDAADKSVEADPQALYDYYRTFTASLKPITHSPLLKEMTGKDFGAEYDKVAQLLNPAVDISYHISTKKYSAAIYDASILLSSLNNVVDEKQHSVFKPVAKLFVRYGTLISTVANAQSSDEVKQALKASVLPVGSYSIKRKTNWSLSINSYAGAYWSYTNSKDYLPSLGLSAPVGFSISKGFSKNGNCGGISLNLQIIDIGALVNYYLIKGDTASLPNNFSVKLSNVFAPGFNLCYNVPKTPLSLAWGGQYVPTLYKYQQVNGKNEITPENAWRWQLSLLIDIPMYNVKVWDFKN